MNRILRELYGAGILFFYFLKWPIFLGYPYLYINGLNNNPILSALWIFTLFLILKDFYALFNKKNKNDDNKEN